MDETAVGALILGGSAVLVAPVIWATTARAADGRLARNGAVGLRIRATLASDEGWELGHRAALPWARRTAVAAALLGLLGVVLALADRAVAGYVLGSAAMIVILAGSLPAVLAARRAAPPPG